MKILVIGYGQIAEEFARLNPQFQILGIRRQNTSKLSNVEIINEDYSSGISITAQKFDPDWIIYFPKIKNSGLSEYENGYLKQLNNLYDFFPSAKKIFISSTRVFSGYANLEVDESVYIPINTKHRLRNCQSEPLEIIEVQTGDYLGEDDIERYDDDYGRTNKN